MNTFLLGIIALGAYITGLVQIMTVHPLLGAGYLSVSALVAWIDMRRSKKEKR